MLTELLPCVCSASPDQENGSCRAQHRLLSLSCTPQADEEFIFMVQSIFSLFLKHLAQREVAIALGIHDHYNHRRTVVWHNAPFSNQTLGCFGHCCLTIIIGRFLSGTSLVLGWCLILSYCWCRGFAAQALQGVIGDALWQAGSPLLCQVPVSNNSGGFSWLVLFFNFFFLFGSEWPVISINSFECSRVSYCWLLLSDPS